jgi:putative ABC transport system substrate-binding protein
LIPELSTRNVDSTRKADLMWNDARQGLRMRKRCSRTPLAGLIGIAGVAILLAASGGPGSAKSSNGPIRTVGLMHVGLDHVPPSLVPLASQLKQDGWDVPLSEVKQCATELRERCDFKGKNIDLIWRNLGDEDAARVQARAFVREHVDVIVAFEDQTVRQAKAATARIRIPVVFLHPADPVASGYIKSLAHPGGNITGVFGLRDLVAKQLELYKLVVPGLRRVLTLVDPQDPTTGPLFKQARAAAASLHLGLAVRTVTTPDDLVRVFHSLRPGEVDGVFVVSPKLKTNFTLLMISLSQAAHIPFQAHNKEWVRKGALFSYGPNFELIGREGAGYVDRILRGAKPSDLPVTEEPRVEFAINLATARKLGIHVPQSIIIRADEVYQ